ncbi:hypothetical protein AGMMS49965_04050 [Bacteroidia bacterium]|nr:hypothetical protein AGMMS49965_04050 [Bacteroidia bacterium]
MKKQLLILGLLAGMETAAGAQMKLSGYAHVIYGANETPALGLGNKEVNSSFDLARACMTASGMLGEAKQVKYFLQYDFVQTTAGLLDLYGEWNPLATVGVRVGQYKIPFSIEMPIVVTKIETIYATRSVKEIAHGRDIGLQISGKAFTAKGFQQLEYAAGLFNGTGKNAKENNNHKDFVGTVYVQPIKGLRLNGSLYTGKADGSRDRWTAGIDYIGTHFSGRSEYLSANDGGTHRRGYYGLAVWKLVPEKWEILGKYDVYNSNTAEPKNEIRDITAGINYYFAYLTRVQLNFITTADQKTDGTNNAVAACVQLYF